MRLDDAGQVVRDSWKWMGNRYEHVTLDEYIIMPNHFHGIIVLHDVGAVREPPLRGIDLSTVNIMCSGEDTMEEIGVHTRHRNEFVDITAAVRGEVKKSGVENGVCYLYVPHTTAGITINEAADPSVVADIRNTLASLVPDGGQYAHAEGNADAHIKSTLVGCSQNIFVENGDLVLGTWQGIFFCEFDGPRTRKVYINIIPVE